MSVVVPVHDRTEFLAEALDSILNQDYRGPIEVIVIDDGSAEPFAHAFQPRYPTVRFIRTENRGIAKTRDDGARLATGDLVAYLDDDDRWPLDSLRRRVEVLLAHPELNVVGGDSRLFRPGHLSDVPYFQDRYPRLAQADHVGDGTVRIYSRGALLDMFLLGLPFYAQTLLVRRAWFLEHGAWGREASIFAECYDFWYRATVHGPIGFLTEPVVEIRRGHDQATADVPGSRLRESEDLVRWSRTLDGMDRKRVVPRLVRRFAVRVYFNLRHGALRPALIQVWCMLRVAVRNPSLASKRLMR